MNKPKNKINKTSRIRIGNDRVVYTSSDMIRQLKHHLLRLNQVMVVKKDHMDELTRELSDLMRKHPDHFPHSSKQYILGVGTV